MNGLAYPINKSWKMLVVAKYISRRIHEVAVSRQCVHLDLVGVLFRPYSYRNDGNLLLIL
jgi:hypothetical protein